LNEDLISFNLLYNYLYTIFQHEEDINEGNIINSNKDSKSKNNFPCQLKLVQEQTLKIFRTYDKNHKGFITKDEAISGYKLNNEGLLAETVFNNFKNNVMSININNEDKITFPTLRTLLMQFKL